MNKFYDHLEEYLKESDSYDAFPDDLRRLAKKSLVAYYSDQPYKYKNIVVQPEFLTLLFKDDMFAELLDLYPNKVSRPDGMIQYLRRDKRVCKDIYSILTKEDRIIHEHIMNCLKFELQYRKKSNGMQWMKTLQNWLTGREWENFEDLVADGTSLNPKQTYGTNLE